MSLLKTYLPKANRSRRLIINGWIRKLEKKYNLNNIPIVIQLLCIVYFNDYDEFAECGSRIIISSDKRMITHDTMTHACDSHCFGSLQISSLSNDTIYKWDIQITKLNPVSCWNIMIGVSSKFKLQKSIPWGDIHVRAALEYAYSDNGDILSNHNRFLWKKYGNPSVENDIISVELDLNKQQIRFYINDKDQGIAYENIKTGKDIKYRFVVGALIEGAQLTLINFTKKYVSINKK